jgi:hemerythrin-like domain-containing protein
MLRMLDCVERAAEAIRAGGPVSDVELVEIIMLMNGLVCRGHYSKENRQLEVLRDRGYVPPGRFQKEHDDSIDFAAAMLVALPEAVRGKASARRMLAENATACVGFMRAHVAREEKLVFALADAVLTGEDAADLVAAFKRIDRETGGPLEGAMMDGIERSLTRTLAGHDCVARVVT